MEDLVVLLGEIQSIFILRKGSAKPNINYPLYAAMNLNISVDACDLYTDPPPRKSLFSFLDNKV